MNNIKLLMDKQSNIAIANHHSIIIDFNWKHKDEIKRKYIITQLINVITYLRYFVWPNTRNL